MASWSWLRKLFVDVPSPEAAPEVPPTAAPDEGRDRAAARVRREGTPPGGPNRGSHAMRWIAVEQRTFRRSVIFVLVAVTGWMLALWLFRATAHFLFLLLLAWLLAIAMEPEIRWFTRHGLNRVMATSVTGVLAIILFLGVFAIFGTELAQQVTQLVAAWPDMVATAVNWLDSTFHLSLDPTKITSAIDLSRLNDLGSTVAQGAFGILGTLGSLTFDLLTVIVFAFYFAAGSPQLIRQVASWLPPGQQEVFATVWETSTAKTGGYVISKLILITLSTFFHAIFFYAIGLPGWLPLALLTGITSQFIPMIGTYIGVLAAVLVALFVDPLDALWVVVFATVYQQVENYIFTPRVSRRVMDVSAPIALAAVFVGVSIWGPIGALIGIPLVAALVALLETYGHPYELVTQIADIAEGATPNGPELAEPGDRAEEDRADGAARDAEGGSSGEAPPRE